MSAALMAAFSFLCFSRSIFLRTLLVDFLGSGQNIGCVLLYAGDRFHHGLLHVQSCGSRMCLNLFGVLAGQ